VDEDAISDALKALSDGESGALDRLFPIVYQEMRRLAAGYLRGERPGHTLQPTALAHEAYIRVVGHRGFTAQSRAQFLGLVARAMREVLVDHARRRRAQKRGGGQAPIPLDATIVVADGAAVEFDDLDRALKDLAKLSERQARVVEVRFFGGLTIEESAELLGISAVTVKRDWAVARAWLYRELTGSGADGV
jgi:RNA polymerase sigma factor (TIGR02999 family)